MVEVPQRPGLGVDVDMGRIEEANKLHEKVGAGARDDAMAMRYLIPGWTYEPKRPSMVR